MVSIPFFLLFFFKQPFYRERGKKKRTIPKVPLAPRGRPRSPSPSPRLCLADLGGICPRRLAACPQPSPATGRAWKGAAARGRVGRGGQRGPGRPEGLFHPCTSPRPPCSPRCQLCASSLPLLVLGVPQHLKGALGFIPGAAGLSLGAIKRGESGHGACRGTRPAQNKRVWAMCSQQGREERLCCVVERLSRIPEPSSGLLGTPRCPHQHRDLAAREHPGPAARSRRSHCKPQHAGTSPRELPEPHALLNHLRSTGLRSPCPPLCPLTPFFSLAGQRAEPGAPGSRHGRPPAQRRAEAARRPLAPLSPWSCCGAAAAAAGISAGHGDPRRLCHGDMKRAARDAGLPEGREPARARAPRGAF